MPRKKKEEFKYTNSKDTKLFPHKIFPWRLEDKKENKLCWFECQEHVMKYVERYKLTKTEYKCQFNTSK